MKTLFGNRRGSVTVFASIVLVTVLVAGSLAYDAWIFSSVKFRFRSAVKGALSSVVADCDDYMLREFGIFSLNLNTEREQQRIINDFNRYLHSGVSLCGLGTKVLRNAELNEPVIRGIQKLTNEEVFVKQVIDSGKSAAIRVFAEQALNALNDFIYEFKEGNWQAGLCDSNYQDITYEAAAGDGVPGLGVLKPLLELAGNLFNKGGGLLKTLRPSWLADLNVGDDSFEDAADYVSGFFDINNFINAFGGLFNLKIPVVDLFKSGSVFLDLESAAEISVDKLYITSYILDHFSFMVQGERAGRYFSFGEIEYILFGKSMQIHNIGLTAYGIFIIRLAIDTAAYYAKSVCPDPRLRLIEAAVSGALSSVSETCGILNGETVDLAPGISNVKTDYKFYLLLLLMYKLLQNENEVLLRTKHIIQVNTLQQTDPFRLADMYTGITCNIRSSCVLPLTRRSVALNAYEKVVY